ncbi:MAG: heparan-alpha-glucosaminide N-acetyltransferase domain-containing protein [Vicinamibacterales bacterium]
MTAATLPAQTTAARLVSIDAFRGLTMAAMVIVNNPGDWGNVYWPLLHAPWHGLTPTDLIFPFFLFIVGVSIPLSRRNASVSAILKRALLIFALGMLLALYPRFDFATVRIPGVLQRIALCYLAVALFHRTISRRDTLQPVLPALITTALILIGYWLLVMRDLTPDGNLGAAIDRAIFGPHLWRQGRTWDPEGLLSTLPAIGTTLTGLAAGYVVIGNWPSRDKLRALSIAAVIAIAAGLAWSTIFPLNKSLWTSSYVLVTSGLAALALAGLHWAFDGVARSFSSGAPFSSGSRLAQPFVILGRNALLLFVVSGLLAKTLALIRVDNGQSGTMALGRWLYVSWFAPFAAPKVASLLFAFANLAVLFVLLWWLHRRRWYFRV